MALTAAQIIARACAIAKVPGYMVQAGQYLNTILSDLCQTYDFDFAKETQIITLDPSTGTYALDADCLRVKEVFYSVNGTIFYLFQIPIETYHALFQGPGVSSYPNKYAIDVSASPFNILFYPPPNIPQTVTVNYYPQKADIATPESSSTVPWFPNQQYLIKKVAANLMMESDDDRQPSFDRQAEEILSKFLVMKDSKENISDTVKLSRERFRATPQLPSSKAFPLG